MKKTHNHYVLELAFVGFSVQYRSIQNIHSVFEIQNYWVWNLKSCTCVLYRIGIVSARSVSNMYRYGWWLYRPSPNFKGNSTLIGSMWNFAVCSYGWTWSWMSSVMCHVSISLLSTVDPHSNFSLTNTRLSYLAGIYLKILAKNYENLHKIT